MAENYERDILQTCLILPQILLFMCCYDLELDSKAGVLQKYTSLQMYIWGCWLCTGLLVRSSISTLYPKWNEFDPLWCFWKGLAHISQNFSCLLFLEAQKICSIRALIQIIWHDFVLNSYLGDMAFMYILPEVEAGRCPVIWPAHHIDKKSLRNEATDISK